MSSLICINGELGALRLTYLMTCGRILSQGVHVTVSKDHIYSLLILMRRGSMVGLILSSLSVFLQSRFWPRSKDLYARTSEWIGLENNSISNHILNVFIATPSCFTCFCWHTLAGIIAMIAKCLK